MRALGLAALVGCASVVTTIPTDAISWVPPPPLRSWGPPAGAPAGLPAAAVDASELPWIEGSGGRLPRLESEVRLRALGDEAEITLRQRFRNDRPRAIEAVFVAPRAGGEVVASRRMTLADRVLERTRPGESPTLPECDAPRPEGYIAELLDRDPVLADTQWIPEIPAGAEVVVEQRTLRRLVHDAGELEIALAIDGDTEIEIEVEAPGPIHAWRASTPALTAEVTGSRGRFTLARDPSRAAGALVLRTRSADAEPQGALFVGPRGVDGWGAFMLTIEPPHLDIDAVVGARELIFVDLAGPSLAAMAAVDAILAAARPSDTVQVYQGASAYTLFAAPQPVSATSRARVDASFVDDPRQRSAATAPLLATLATPPGEGRRRHLIFIGDGGPWRRSTAPLRSIVRLVRDLDPRSRVFTVGLHEPPGEPSLAQAGMTAAVALGDRRVGEEVRRYLDRVVWGDVEIDWGDLEIDAPVHAALTPHTLYAGGPLRIFGRYRGDPPAAITARGRQSDAAVALAIPVRPAGSEAAPLHARWAEAAQRHRHAVIDDLWPRALDLVRFAPAGLREDGAPVQRGRDCRFDIGFERRWSMWTPTHPHHWSYRVSPPSRREEMAVADLSPLAGEDARGARLGGMPSAESQVVVDGVPVAGSALTRVTPDESMGTKRDAPRRPTPPPRARVRVATPVLHGGGGDPRPWEATLQAQADALAGCFTLADRETFRVRRRLRLRFARDPAGAAELAVVADEALPLAIGACLRETIDRALPAGPVALEIPLTVRMRF